MKKTAQIIRGIIYYLFGVFDDFLNIKVPDIVVICYHGIGIDDWQYNISLEEFKKQVDVILKLRTPMSLSQLTEYIQGKRKIEKPSFVITFDDGYKNVLNCLEYLKNKDIKPGVFLLSNEDGVNRSEMGNSLELLTSKDVSNLVSAGWEIGSHGATHQDFSCLSTDEITKEIKVSKSDLEKNLVTEVQYIAYPKGRYTNSILDEVKQAGYKLGLTMDDSFISRQTNPLLVPRIGVDKSHKIYEFKGSFSPTVIKLRHLLKKININKIYG